MSTSPPPLGLCYSSFPQRCYSYKGGGVTIKRSIVPIKDALGYLRETQRYIQTITERQSERSRSMKVGKSKMKEVLFPEAPIALTKRKLGGRSTIESPFKAKTSPRDLASSLSEMSLFHSTTSMKQSLQSDYTVTHYMLTRPMSMRANMGVPTRKKGEKEAKPFMNPRIESFLNRFEKTSDRVSLPGIVLNPGNE